ncbi:hypothetical protein M1271_07275 [Patescibacteria group bacterium]|nr:hypothetical protein [Patescibacteria group bacterium]
MSPKEKFYKIYGNLPLATRDEIILTINGEGISWKVAKLYIDQNSSISQEILDKLDALKII